jgi:hypothetical protein
VPSFCRHNRLVQNCPICTREQSIELRPLVSSSAPKASSPRPSRSAGRGANGAPAGGPARSAGGARHGGGLRVRRLARGLEDGYRSGLVPGVRSSTDAERLAEELAFAAGRLALLERNPPGLYAEVADETGELEERTWLAFLIAYLCPLDDERPYAAIEAVRSSWASGLEPELNGVATGPLSAHEPGRGTATLEAYRAWAARAGSQAAAFTGEPSWTPERRFARAYERLALPGLRRAARFELLVSLGQLRCYELRAGALELGGDDGTTVAAKRALGIGDTLLLERRAAELARACELPLAALDLGLRNWDLTPPATRIRLGVPAEVEPDPDALATARSALGL